MQSVARCQLVVSSRNLGRLRNQGLQANLILERVIILNVILDLVSDGFGVLVLLTLTGSLLNFASRIERVGIVKSLSLGHVVDSVPLLDRELIVLRLVVERLKVLGVLSDTPFGLRFTLGGPVFASNPLFYILMFF